MSFVSKGNLIDIYIAQYFQMLSLTDLCHRLARFRVVGWNNDFKDFVVLRAEHSLLASDCSELLVYLILKAVQGCKPSARIRCLTSLSTFFGLLWTIASDLELFSNKKY